MKKLLILLFFFGFLGYSNAQNFIKETTIERGDGSMNIIDFDGDDNLDLLFTNSLSTLHLEWESDTFKRVIYPAQLPNEYLPFANPGTFSFEDYDGDGDMDVLMIGKTAFSIFDLNPFDRSFILKNNNGRFEPIEVTNDIEPVRRKWFDYDFDGDLDLLQSLDKIYQNTGSGYELTDDIIKSPSGRKFLYKDLDNDSDKDLVITAQSASYIYENIESRFFLKDSTSIPPVRNSTLAVGDVNNDGFNDIVVGGTYTNSLQEYTSVKAFWNDGSGNFTLSDTIYDPIDDGPFSFTFPEDLRIQDIDSDGINDIYVKTERPFHVFRTTDNSEIQIDLDPEKPFHVFGDIDHDGKLDIWNTPNNKRIVYKNNFPGTNNAPQPPTNVQVSNKGAITYFNWSAGTDDYNTPQTLTYNVKIGTTSGGSEMLSCNSNTNGKRQQYTPGNSGFGTFHKIKNLPAGDYFFSIQSIDGSYIGSEFVTIPFTVNPSLSEPKLVSPFDRFEPLPIRSEFRWEPVNNAEDYNIQVATDPKFQNIVIDKSNIVTVFDTLVLPDCHTEYFWRVKGEATGFESAWSYIYSLKTCPVFTNIDTLGASTLNDIHLMKFVDIDNDGDPDLAALHGTYGNVFTFEANFYKNENGVFSHFSTAERVAHVNDSWNQRVLWSWADRDLDGDFDFYITGLRFQESLFFENDGSGVFTRDSLLDFPAGTEIQWFDAENDNLPDAIIPFSDQFNVMVRQNNFASLGVSGRGGDRMEPVDVNNDGRVDIVTLTQGVIFNNGNLNFVENTINPFEPVSKGDIAVADVDGNGFMDIFGSGIETGFNNTRRFYFNNQGFFEPAIDLPKGTVRDACFTDFNVDGKPDLAYTGLNSGIILRNEEGNLNPFFDFEDNINAIAFTDFDNDGDEDMAYAFANSNSIFLGVNNEGSENAAPFFRAAPPTDLNADVQGQNVLLSFLPEVRKTTFEQGTGATYNIVVGTVEGKTDIMSPLADLTTGKNYLPKKGNIGLSNEYLLKGLQNGTYYWSVQTIAANGSSSEFAVWKSFQIGNSAISEVEPVKDILIVPNPVKGKISIKFHAPIAKRTEGIVFNDLGQMAETFEIEKGLESMTFDASNLRPGIYLLRIDEMVDLFLKI